jgi:hypothetical protein
MLYSSTRTLGSVSITKPETAALDVEITEADLNVGRTLKLVMEIDGLVSPVAALGVADGRMLGLGLSGVSIVPAVVEASSLPTPMPLHEENRRETVNFWSMEHSQSSFDESEISAFQSLDELFELHDAAIVDAAYHVMFGRRVDPTGMKYYVRRLRKGYGRVAMLDQLAKGDAGRRIGGCWKEVEGLEQALHRFRAARRSPLSWWRLLTDAEIGLPRFRHARAVNNSLGRLRQEFMAIAIKLRANQEGGIMVQPPMRAADEFNAMDLSQPARMILNKLRL